MIYPRDFIKNIVSLFATVAFAWQIPCPHLNCSLYWNPVCGHFKGIDRTFKNLCHMEYAKCDERKSKYINAKIKYVILLIIVFIIYSFYLDWAVLYNSVCKKPIFIVNPQS